MTPGGFFSLARLLVQRMTRVLAWVIATGLGSGFSPIAPGTAGSLVAVVVYYFSPFESWVLLSRNADPFRGPFLGFYLLIVLGFFIGIWAANAVSSPSDPDPGHIVWDEFVGMWITCLFLPKDLFLLAIAFLAFRVFDIVKPFPIRRLERLPGGLGIMADDVLAGVYGVIVCQVVLVLVLASSN